MMGKWRLGISAKLFAAIFSTCLLVLVTMHWGVRLSFEYGFVNYIKRGNEHRLMLLGDALAEEYTQHGNWTFLRHNTKAIFRILHALEQTPDASTLPPRGWRTQFWVIDQQYKVLVGPPRPPPAEGRRYPITTASGKIVGWVIGSPSERLTRIADINFDQQQRRTSWLIVALATLLAALVTWRLSRGLLAPVKRLVAGTHQLAAGDFSTRVTPGSRDELGQLAQDFNRLAGSLEKNQRMRRAFMADISHELRTPLAVLRGELEAIQDGVHQLTPEVMQALQGEVATLTKLVDDVHQLSLSDEGALAYRKSTIDLVPLLQLTVANFQARLERHPLRVQLTLPQQALQFGDPDRLQQLFSNLLENSLRYTDPGGWLHIDLTTDQQDIAITFEDSAPGVTDQQLSHLFERFYRTEGSRNRASGGSGLGLAICQNIVDAHDGRLTAAHSAAGGLAVRVYLPHSPHSASGLASR